MMQRKHLDQYLTSDKDVIKYHLDPLNVSGNVLTKTWIENFYVCGQGHRGIQYGTA